MKFWKTLTLFLFSSFVALTAFAAGGGGGGAFPVPLDSYNDSHLQGIGEILSHRIHVEPFNLVASVIFLCAILHTFFASKITHWAHEVAHHHAEKLKTKQNDSDYEKYEGPVSEVSFKAEILHFLGEVEAVFGLWVIVLAVAFSWFKGWHSFVDYIAHGGVNFTEPMFVVVIMTLAATRPVMKAAEQALQVFASLGKGTSAAWWFAILTIGPILGSFITEPGAMTIAAMLLGKQIYEKKPSAKFAYATIGLLFVNISVGGTLTHFAAPPVLMVAGKWNWDMMFMLEHFGWKAVVGILIANVLYYFAFRGELQRLSQVQPAATSVETKVNWEEREIAIPAWITVVHLVFMAWTVFNAHYPALFIGGFLFFLGFAQATAHHQNRVNLKPALLVGFFLAGLVTHGGLQGWWIAPVLGSLSEVPLMLGATVLTAFNDNAAITYLSTLVPGFTDSLKYAVVAGAVTGGGLTVIANAPNPAGQSILGKYFEGGVSPLWLMVGALIPTIIMGLAFMLL